MSDLKIRLVSNWCDNDHLRELWNRMTPHGDYRWNDLVVLPAGDRSVEDWFVVVNCPKLMDVVVPSRSVVVSMEPRAHFRTPAPWNGAGRTADGAPAMFGIHDGGRNTVEWHLARTYRQLKSETVTKTRLISSVTSGLRLHRGQRLRHDFLGYLDAHLPALDLYGRDRLPYRSYRGPLPYYAKDEGLIPYRYTFAAENVQERGYFTEKIVDAILAECLCFYWGCPNLADYIDPAAYIRIDLLNPVDAIERVRAAIDADEWAKRIAVIRREKLRILDELQFFPALERFLAARPRPVRPKPTAPARRRLTIAFHDDRLTERGTTVALYDYAHHNERTLGNTSVILHRRGQPGDHPAVQTRFRRRFRLLQYETLDDIESLVERERIDAVYWIKFGTRDGQLVRSCRNLVHAVFASDPHGDRYAVVSAWMTGRSAGSVPFVPHMIDLPACGEDLRGPLGIPRDALVLGRYGGRETFDLPFVHEVVLRAVQDMPHVYVLLANTDRFSAPHPQIIHVDALVDPADKVRFINTCDAMLHARQRGETFGLAVGEFSSLNRPVLTYRGSPESAHIEILGTRGLYYDGPDDLYALVGRLREVIAGRQDWNAYRAFTPRAVMARFRDVFLVDHTVKVTSPDRNGAEHARRYASTYQDVAVVPFDAPGEDAFVVVDAPHADDAAAVELSRCLVLRSPRGAAATTPPWNDADPLAVLAVRDVPPGTDVVEFAGSVLSKRKRQAELVNATLDIVCINVARHTERWRRSATEFARYGLPVQRVDAVDGTALAFENLVVAGVASAAFDPIGRRQPGVLGLLLTSADLWKRIAEKPRGKWTLVCEDDIWFHPEFLEHFAVFWSEVPADAEIVYFGFQYPGRCDPHDERVLAHIATPVGRHVLRLRHWVNGAHAYAINRDSARRLVTDYLPVTTALDKFPPDRFHVYAFRRPPGTDARMIERLYVDREQWEGRHVVSHHGLIATRAERSTIGHLPYHYLWFAREAREGGRYREAFEYLMRIKADPARYDAVTTDFAVWHELALIGARVDRRAGAAALEELVRRSDRHETRHGLLLHADALRACAAEYDQPGLTAALDEVIDRARRAAGPFARAGTGDA